MFYSLLALGFCLVTWLMIYAICAQKWFSEWNLKNQGADLVSLHNRLWYDISFDTLFQAWSDVSVEACVDVPRLVEWVNAFVLVGIVENEFWGRQVFLPLRRCFQSGFRKPSRTMCAHDSLMNDFIFVFSTFSRELNSADRSFGFNSSDEHQKVLSQRLLNGCLEVLKCIIIFRVQLLVIYRSEQKINCWSFGSQCCCFSRWVCSFECENRIRSSDDSIRFSSRHRQESLSVIKKHFFAQSSWLIFRIILCDRKSKIFFYTRGKKPKRIPCA